MTDRPSGSSFTTDTTENKTDKTDKKNKTKIEAVEKLERVFKNQKKVHHDLFKLNVSNMLKNIAWDGTEDLRNVEHCHFFHTVDSNGRPQLYSSAIGGHFHKMEIIKMGDGVPTVKCVSGPLRFAKIKNKRTGRYEKVTIPCNDYDNHTHEIEYLKSDEISLRKINPEAVAVQTIEANKTKPVPGIIG